jgi:hypothetical protein
MTKVKIYQPAKTSMQSGRSKTKQWLLEYELETKRSPENLNGWIASGDTLNQVKMCFSSADEAIQFAQKNGWDYTLTAPIVRRIKGRTYMDNFKYVPVETKS